MIFDPHLFEAQADSGKPFDTGPLLNFIRSYDRVVLYGAADLGCAIRQILEKRGVTVHSMWDLRWADMPGVKEPYSDAPPEGTLVIVCVGVHVYMREVLKAVDARGYAYIRGDLIFQALGCGMTTRTGVDAEACLRGCCRSIYCKRLSAIVEAQHSPKVPPFSLHSMTLVVNQVCTLSCKYCTSYLNRYPPQDRINFDAEQMVRDIAVFFGALDSCGTITIMGGEPFLHPDISTITQAVLDSGKVGVISISTSGTVKFKPSQLAVMKDRRVNISFSNYLDQLTERQQEMVWENMALLDEFSIPFTIGPPGRLWVIPSTLSARNLDEAGMREAKRVCGCDTIQLKNGLIHPCDFSQAVYGLKLQDYPDSYLLVGDDPMDLRARLIEWRGRDYYGVCDRCKGCQGTTSAAGEQGYLDMMEEVK